jgi:phospholipid transport system substrate-binding protein
MRYLFVAILLLVAANLGGTAPASANPPSDVAESKSSDRAIHMVNDLTTEAMRILGAKLSKQDREIAFGELVDRYLNVKRVARFTLGRSARTVGDEDKLRFEEAFRYVLIKIYSNRLAGYTEEKVIVTKAKTKGRNNLVNSQIIFATERPPVDMVWWVIEEKDGTMSLFDVQILGVWMAQEQRDIFSGVLKSNKGDIEALIEHLLDQVAGTEDDNQPIKEQVHEVKTR